jgi:hypothetical protein
MKTRKTLIRSLAVFVLVVSGMTTVKAQQGRNINFLRVVPQSGYINPAIVPPYDFYIGIPALSSLKLEMSNTPFDYNDVIKTRSDDSLYLDTQALLNSMHKKNYFMTEFADEFLSFGFRVQNAFITFNLSQKFNSNIMIPKEFMSFLINGNAQYLGTSVNVGGLDMSVTNYNELALGLSYVINKQFTAGFRAKYLIGIANLDTKKTDVNIYTPDEFSMTVSTNLEVNATIPGTEPGDSLDFNLDGQDYLKSMTSFDNTGFAVDLGVQYNLNDKTTLGLSVTDWGFINWKTGVRNLVSENESAQTTFSGVEFGRIFTDSADFKKMVNEVLDSLSKELGLKVTYEKYRSSLTPKIYLSGTYSLTPKDHFGGLLRIDIFKGNALPSFTLNYTREFGKAFSLMGGYTIATRSYANIALGFAVNAGPVQLYLMTDNILGIVQLTNTRYANTHFGINLVFGRSKWYNKQADVPSEPVKTD